MALECVGVITIRDKTMPCPKSKGILITTAHATYNRFKRIYCLLFIYSSNSSSHTPPVERRLLLRSCITKVTTRCTQVLASCHLHRGPSQESSLLHSSSTPSFGLQHEHEHSSQPGCNNTLATRFLVTVRYDKRYSW